MQTSKLSWVTRRVAQLPNAAKKSKSVQGRSNAANPCVTLIFRRNDVNAETGGIDAWREVDPDLPRPE
jgi:hypothetical protein